MGFSLPACGFSKFYLENLELVFRRRANCYASSSSICICICFCLWGRYGTFQSCFSGVSSVICNVTPLPNRSVSLLSPMFANSFSAAV